MADTLVVTPETPKLVDADRCDVTCPAQALVRFRYPEDGCLDFCGHHADEYLCMVLASGAQMAEDRRVPENKGTMI